MLICVMIYCNKYIPSRNLKKFIKNFRMLIFQDLSLSICSNFLYNHFLTAAPLKYKISDVSFHIQYNKIYLFILATRYTIYHFLVHTKTRTFLTLCSCSTQSRMILSNVIIFKDTFLQRKTFISA